MHSVLGVIKKGMMHREIEAESASLPGNDKQCYYLLKKKGRIVISSLRHSRYQFIFDRQVRALTISCLLSLLTALLRNRNVGI